MVQISEDPCTKVVTVPLHPGVLKHPLEINRAKYQIADRQSEEPGQMILHKYSSSCTEASLSTFNSEMVQMYNFPLKPYLLYFCNSYRNIPAN